MWRAFGQKCPKYESFKESLRFVDQNLYWKVTFSLFLLNISTISASSKLYTPHGRPQGRRGGGNPPPETEKIVVKKWCYFPELYKMAEVREEGIENR